MEQWFTPIQPSLLPAARSVLVLAPHPDDEVFGCAGAMALYAQRAAAIRVHILTDGAGYAPAADREVIGAVRRAESLSALGKLASGAAIRCEFGPYQDRALQQDAGLVDHIYALLQAESPQLVFAPSPWEIHPDHQACARAALVALQRWQRVMGEEHACSLMFYEIGSPLRANFLLDITAVWPQKKQAMGCFHSQQQLQDYARHIEGLNAYRTYTLPPHVHYAEAYHCLDTNDLLALASSAGVEGLSAQCTGRWLESVLHSASTHAEGLQQTVLEQTRQNAQLREHYENLVAQLQNDVRQQREAVQTLNDHYQRLFSELQADFRQQLRLQSELDATRSSLQQLQNSRAVRWARALRRWLP